MITTISKPEIALISTISIVYFTICGTLWHLGYWSTFEINILQYLSISDIIKSFVYPFLSSVFVSLIIYLVVNYLPIVIYKLNYFSRFPSSTTNNSIVKPKRYWSGSGKDTKLGKFLNKHTLLFLFIYCNLIGVIYLFGNEMKWGILPIFISLPLGIYLSHKEYFIRIISDPDIRSFILTFIVILPLFSFFLAKRESLAIHDNAKYKVVLRIESNSQPKCKDLIGYKLLGSAGNKLFLSKLDNTELVYVNDNTIDFISYQKKRK
jgi:hypothetical protein